MTFSGKIDHPPCGYRSTNYLKLIGREKMRCVITRICNKILYLIPKIYNAIHYILFTDFNNWKSHFIRIFNIFFDTLISSIFYA